MDPVYLYFQVLIEKLITALQHSMSLLMRQSDNSYRDRNDIISMYRTGLISFSAYCYCLL